MSSAPEQLPDPNAPYEVVQMDAPAVADDGWTEEGEDWLLTVACPRCSHRADKRFAPQVLSHFREDGAADAVMRCNCPSPHDGRESGQGCGAWWGFEVGPA